MPAKGTRRSKRLTAAPRAAAVFVWSTARGSRWTADADHGQRQGHGRERRAERGGPPRRAGGAAAVHGGGREPRRHAQERLRVHPARGGRSRGDRAPHGGRHAKRSGARGPRGAQREIRHVRHEPDARKQGVHLAAHRGHRQVRHQRADARGHRGVGSGDRHGGRPAREPVRRRVAPRLRRSQALHAAARTRPAATPPTRRSARRTWRARPGSASW